MEEGDMEEGTRPKGASGIINDVATTLLRFEDGTTSASLFRPDLLREMSYFEPFLTHEGYEAEAAIFTPVIPVPCSSCDFIRVLSMLERRKEPLWLCHVDEGELPTANLYDSLLETADKLGLQRKTYDDLARWIYTGLPRLESALAEVCPRWWRVSTYCVARTGPRRDSNSDRLVHVDRELASSLHFVSLRHGTKQQQNATQSFLFPNCTERSPRQQSALRIEVDASGGRSARNSSILADDPPGELMRRCDARVLDALRRHAGKLCLAGGAVLSAVSREGVVGAGSDYDLFVVTKDEEEADAVVKDVMAALTRSSPHPERIRTRQTQQTPHKGHARRRDDRFFATERAITVFMPAAPPVPVSVSSSMNETDEGKEEQTGKQRVVVDVVVVQIILRMYPTVDDVIRTFDLGPSQVAVAFFFPSVAVEDTEPEMQIVATPLWLECMRHLAFPVNVHNWSTATPARVLKYVGKGFEAVIPGLSECSRSAHVPVPTDDVEYCFLNDMPYLLYLERAIETMRGSNSSLPDDNEVRRAMRALSKSSWHRASDYFDGSKHERSRLGILMDRLGGVCGSYLQEARRFLRISLTGLTMLRGRREAEEEEAEEEEDVFWTWKPYVDIDPYGLSNPNLFCPLNSGWTKVLGK